jgi:hypothetical protein
LFLSVSSVNGEIKEQETVVEQSIGNNSKPSNLRGQSPNVFSMCIPVLDLWSEKVKDIGFIHIQKKILYAWTTFHSTN